MLLGLLIHWASTGEPHYASMNPGQTIAYISDIGAQSLKPLFIAGACVTTIFLDLAFVSDVWLRHRGRLAGLSSTGRAVSIASLVFAAVGTAGLSKCLLIVLNPHDFNHSVILGDYFADSLLVLLSIFDTLRHPTLHDIFLLLFIAGYVISAIFICWEYQRLGIRTSPSFLQSLPCPQFSLLSLYIPSHNILNNQLIHQKDYRQHRVLRISFWIKLVFIIIEVILAIAFGSCNFKKAYNAAAVLEWAIAFIFTFYVFSFFIDLIPAVHTKHGKGAMGGETEMEREANDGIAERREYDGYRE